MVERRWSKVNNCTEFLELISAYADDELTESDRRRVEEHLSECDDCSALLDLYREISSAASLSSEPAPEALFSGVMDKILSGEADSTADHKSAIKPGIIRMALTRYLPVAACLAIMLITLPRIINYRSGQNGESGATPMSDQISIAPAAPSAMPDAAMEAGGGMTGSSDELSGSDTGGAFGGNTDGSEAPSLSEAPPAEPFAEEPDMGGESRMTQSFTEASDDMDSTAHDDPADNSAVMWIQNEIKETLGEFSDAYAWIEITGHLPKLLQQLEPVPLPADLSYEVYYWIPGTVVDELIKEADFSDGIEIAVYINNIDGDYAIVLYTSSEG